jgi:enterochelin esterase family protein
MKAFAVIVASLNLVGWAAPGQNTSAHYTPPSGSPEVSKDRRVTFRLRAPNAREVLVTGRDIGRLSMQKDGQGVWSVTTNPLAADIYEYSFSVDGASFPDPGNPARRTAYLSIGNSLVRVPGSMSWDPADVPRGAVTRHFYRSAIVGDDRDFYVYTPPGYTAARREPYPVLFLLHGAGDEAAGWFATGAANVILDNLIAQGKAEPMILVAPLAYGVRGIEAGPDPGMVEKNNVYFARALLEEVMPQVEKGYHVSQDRERRAIAGLSMGGAEALFTGLNHLDKFAWVASFSGGIVTLTSGMWNRGPRMPQDSAEFSKVFPTLDAKANSRLKLLWISCGTEDPLVSANRQFKSWLKQRQVVFKDLEKPGAHTWAVWRRDLADLAPLLFR